jgi:hypothetical protein
LQEAAPTDTGSDPAVLAGQLTQTPQEELKYWPRTQRVQLAEPTVEKALAAQETHEVAPMDEWVLAGQEEQTVSSLASAEAVPAGHARQLEVAASR